jgi:hypothetical protein
MYVRIGGLVGYDFGTAALTVYATNDVLSRSYGGNSGTPFVSEIPFTSETTTKGWIFFGRLIYRLAALQRRVAAKERHEPDLIGLPPRAAQRSNGASPSVKWSAVRARRQRRGAILPRLNRGPASSTGDRPYESEVVCCTVRVLLRSGKSSHR